MNTRLFVVVGCHGDARQNIPPCPFRTQERTPGAGYADDLRCSAVISKQHRGVYAMIDGYVEWGSDMRKPGDFPAFCPFAKNTRGYKPRRKAGQ